MRHLPYEEASPQEAAEFVRIADLALKEFHGDFDELEKAVGMLLCGRKVGWKVLVLIHDKKTIRKYGRFSGSASASSSPRSDPGRTSRLPGNSVQKVTNFWKAVSGDIPGIRTPEITK